MDDPELEMPSDSSSIGEAVSGRGPQNLPHDEDDLYYIPERRPSLDLGQSPMDTNHWLHSTSTPFHAPSPALSYVSQATTEGSFEMDAESEPSTRVQLDRTGSYSSCSSWDSEESGKRIFKKEMGNGNDKSALEPPDTPELTQVQNEMWHSSLTVAFTFKAICNTLAKLSERALIKFKTMLWKNYPQSINTISQGMDLVDMVDRLLECYSLAPSLHITITVLEQIGLSKVAAYLQNLYLRNKVRHELSETLKRKYCEAWDDMDMQEVKMPFDDIYTNLHITSTCNNGPNIEHEVITIDKLDSNQEAGKQLSTEDIFSAESLHSNPKLMLITGVAGSGKSMLVRKLVLDWIEGRSHEHVSFMFPLPLRELRQFEDSTVSFLQIIQKLYPETQKLKQEDYRSDDCKIMFVFDGLDEYKGNLDFHNTQLLCDHTEPTTLNIIVVNLLRGRLLHHGLFLFITRPQVQRCIPWDTHYNEIEVRGFCDHEKFEYFQRRFRDPDQAAKVIAYIKSFKTLSIMCHLPLFCSVVANECHRIISRQGTSAELPRSITYMYTKLVLALTHQRCISGAPDSNLDIERDLLMKLGMLALNMLEQRQFKITRCDWRKTGIDEEAAVTNSGLCTEYLTQPYVLFHEKVLSFIHPTVQEYLAALYAFLSFRNQGKNVFEQQKKASFKGMFKGSKVIEVYKSAVERSLICEDGKLDIFLRFLCGMAHKTNMELLQPLCTSSANWPTLIEDSAAFIRKRIQENKHPSRNDNLQRCLVELGVLALHTAS